MSKTGQFYYKYKWIFRFFIKSINKHIVPFSVDTVIKNSDYDNAFLPTMIAQLKIKEEDLLYFKKYNNSIVCNVKVIRLSGTELGVYNNEEIIDESTFLPLYDKSKLPNIPNDTKKMGNPYDEDDNSQDYLPSLAQNENHKVIFNMFRIDDIKVKKFIHNYVLHDVTVSDALSLLISENPYVIGAVVDIPDNNTKYEDIIIPPFELKDAIKHLQIRYGIYAAGLRVFMDNGILYILKKVSTEHSYQPNEKQLVRVKLLETSSIPDNSSHVIETEDEVMYVRQSKLEVDDKESVLGELIGDKYVYSNFGSVINSVFSSDGKSMEFNSPINEIERVTNTHIETGTKVVSDYDNLNNVYEISSYVNEQGTGIPVGMALVSVNAEHFGPNKNIYVRSTIPENNTLFSGLYSITSSQFVFRNTKSNSVRNETYCNCSLILNHKYND